MRYGVLSFLCLLAGCDSLWTPACLDNPELAGCRIRYTAVQKYLVTGATQSLLLRAEMPEQHHAGILNMHQENISVSFQNIGTEQEQMRNFPITVIKILSNGDILINVNMESLNYFLQGMIKISFGQSNALEIPMNSMSIGCSRIGLESTIKLGDVSSGKLDWYGIRAGSGHASFFIKEKQNKEMFGDLKIVDYSENKLGTMRIYAGLSTLDIDCKPVITRNNTLQICPRGLYWANEKPGNILKGPFQCDEIIDSKYFGISDVKSENVDTYSVSINENYFAFIEKDYLNVLKFDNVGLIENFWGKCLFSKKTIVQKIKNIIFSDIDQDGRDELIQFDASNQVFVQQNGLAGLQSSAGYHEPLTNALSHINAQDPRPVNALAMGNMFADGSLALLAVKDTDLWLSVLGSSTTSLQAPPNLAEGVIHLKDAFPEPPERLQLVDVNNDGLLDIIAVTARAAYVCPTRVMGG